MKFRRSWGFILIFFVLWTSIGITSGENQSGFLMYIQGGTSNLSEGSQDTMTLTIHDIIPYYTFDSTNRISLVPMEIPNLVEFPLYTALVLNEGG